MSTLLDAPAVLEVEEIASVDALEDLRGEWQVLWDASPRATPFQSPDWLLAWWRHLGGGEMRTLAVRDQGRLVGLLPLFVWPGDGVRQLTPVGNGISDHVDLLAAPGRAREVAEAIFAALAESGGWETADLRDLPLDSPLLAVPVPGSVTAAVARDEPCPVLALPHAASALESVIPREHLKKLRYCRRRLAREFAVAFEPADDDASVDALLAALVRLHAARWAGRGEAGVLDDARVRAFHREAAGALHARGMLRLHALRLDGAVAAVWYGFAAKCRVLYYLGGFDPALERYSIGTVMLGHAIEQAVAEGAAELDFLRGREPYKYAWGAADRPQRRLRLTRSR